MVAAANGYEEVVRLLLRNGADPAIKNKNGFNAVFLAASNNRFAVLKAFEQLDKLKDVVN